MVLTLVPLLKSEDDGCKFWDVECQPVEPEPTDSNVFSFASNRDLIIGLALAALTSRIIDIGTAADSARATQRAMSADNLSARDVWWTAAEDIDADLGTQMDKRSSDWSELVVIVRHHGRQGASASGLLAAARAGQSMNPECMAVDCLTLGRSLPHR